jgi:hypothetical protein
MKKAACSSNTVLGALLLFVLACPFCTAQETGMSPDDQRRVASILRTAHDDVKKYYYDASIHGVDWEGGYARYQALIPKVRNLGEGFRIVAAYVCELKDSHTYFVPPERDLRVDPRYVLGIVGNDCFVTQIRPGSDAATKLHVGDRALKLNEFAANRQDFIDLTYYFETLAPQLAKSGHRGTRPGLLRNVSQKLVRQM